MNTFDRILARLSKAEPSAYQPSFHLEADGANWRVFDGDRALALFYPQFLDIWAFSPFEPDEIANPEPPGKVVDLHTVHNTFLNFGMQEWPKQWAGLPCVWNWLKTAGSELDAEVALAGPEGESCRWRVRVDYDSERAAYRYRVAVHARKLDPEGFEPFNLMLAGAWEDRPERRRWTHSLWENPDGNLRRIVHSNVLFLCTDFGGFRNEKGPWRWRNLPYPRSWMSYAAHPTFNPAFLIHHTTVPLLGATCSALFDEHLIWNRAGQDNLGEDGYFHFSLDLEFVNIPAALAAELLDLARDPMRPSQWRNEPLALPFRIGEENSFETVIDAWVPTDCPFFSVSQGEEGRLSWTTEAAHSGTHSLRLRQETGGRLEWFPDGPVCRVRPHTRYRFSAWVKTQCVTGAARLELVAYAYTRRNICHQSASVELFGTQDWTRLDVDLDSGREAYVSPYVVLEGAGTVWFDDAIFEEIQ